MKLTNISILDVVENQYLNRYKNIFAAALSLLLNVKQYKMENTLKELEHRKLGWKVLILKYDLGKSLSKYMWCKTADTKINLTSYFKRWKKSWNMR